jgi:hypothetical protein
VPVFILQKRDAQLLRCFEADTMGGTHRREQRIGHLHGTDLLALRFDVNGPPGVEAFERNGKLAFECLLRRLRLVGQVAEQRSAVPRERFEIENLGAHGRERAEQPALAGSCEAADDFQPKLRRKPIEPRDHMSTPGSIAAF